MTGLADWFAVFRAGRHTALSGQTRTVTRSDLDRIVERYDGAGQPSPCVITHNELYSPFAYAQIADLRVGAGDVLEARCRQDTIEPQFAALVADGRLYNRSVQLLPDEDAGWRLGHVAFLGAEPPAVKGLEPIRFAATGVVFASEKPWEQVEAVSRWADLVGVVRRLAQRLLEPDDAEAVMPDWMVQDAQREVGRAQERAAREVDEEGDMSRATTYSQAELDTAAEKAAAKAKQEFAAREAALEKERRALARGRLKSRVEELIEAGRVTPAQAEGLVEFALVLEGAAALEFSRGEGEGAATVHTSPNEWLFAFLEKLPVQVEINRETGGAGPERPDLADAGEIRRAALEYQATEQEKGRRVSDAEAVRHVTGRGA